MVLGKIKETAEAYLGHKLLAPSLPPLPVSHRFQQGHLLTVLARFRLGSTSGHQINEPNHRWL